MRKLAFVLVLLFAGSALAQQSVYFDGTVDEALDKAKRENKLVLIDFFSHG